MRNLRQGQVRPSEAGFDALVRDALTHLYDHAHLLTHPLIGALVEDASLSRMAKVDRLRQIILDAIEQLRPPHELPKSSREWRPYLALRYYYVDVLELDEVEARLGLGDRQTLRERIRGVNAVTSILWAEQQGLAIGNTPSAASQEPSGDLLRQELSQIGIERTSIMATEFLRSLCQQVQALSKEQEVLLYWRGPVVDGPVLVDATLLRQAIVGLLTHGIQCAAGGQLLLSGNVEPHSFEITITGDVSAEDWQVDTLATSRALLEAQGATLRLGPRWSHDGLCIRLPLRATARILVIDDNEATLRLYGRFLSNEDYDIATAAAGEIGLSEARARPPDLIILDVMMRSMDGWQVLQALRADPRTADVPVIICSVLADEALALSLGATCLIRKPMDRMQFVQTIASVLEEFRGVH